MSQSFGSWRASYAPGSWVVLAGASSLVVMQPAAPRHSDLIASIWQQVARAESADALLQTLTAIGLSQMPSLGVFFWEGDRMTSLARGEVVVREESTGNVVNHGEGVVTWREASLDPSIVTVEMEDAPEGLVMPLLLGVAQASRLTIDATGTVAPLVVGERGEVDAGASSQAASAAPALPSQEESFAEVHDLGRAPVGQEPEQQESAHDQYRSLASADRSAASASTPAPAPRTPAPNAPAPNAPTSGVWGSPDLPAAESAPSSWSATPEPSTPEPSTPEPPAPEPYQPPQPASSQPPQSQPAWDAQPWQQEESPSQQKGWGDPDSSLAHDGATVFMPGLASQSPSGNNAGAGLVMASMCTAGHPNPPGARSCRLCSAPMDPSGPRLVDRPCLGVLIASTGESIDLLGPVLIGRAPNGGTNDPQAALLRVPSPNQDISRTHVRIAPNEWSIEVTDMNSTNGTLVQHPGEQAIRLAPGETVTVEVGAIVDLGDGITLDIVAPR